MSNKSEAIFWCVKQLERVSLDLERIDQMEVPPRQDGEVFGEGIARTLGRCTGIAASANARLEFVIGELQKCLPGDRRVA